MKSILLTKTKIVERKKKLENLIKNLGKKLAKSIK